MLFKFINTYSKLPLENSSRWKSYNIIQNNTSHTIIPQLGHWVFNFGWAHSFPASGTVISTLAMSTCLEGRRTRSGKKNCISFEVSIIQNNRLFNHSPYIDGWTCRLHVGPIGSYRACTRFASSAPLKDIRRTDPCWKLKLWQDAVEPSFFRFTYRGRIV